jgi:hypothetical protein
MDTLADSDTMVIHLSEIIENDSERRKSSISFGPNLEYPDTGDNPVHIDEKAKDDDEAFKSISYFFPSETRPSIFSRISEKSLADLPISYKYFFLFCSILIIFIMGILVGTLATKYFLCQGFEQDMVNQFHIRNSNIINMKKFNVIT